MTGNLYQDWPVYMLLGAVVFFFIYVIVKGNLQNRKSKAGQDKEKENKDKI